MLTQYERCPVYSVIWASANVRIKTLSELMIYKCLICEREMCHNVVFLDIILLCNVPHDELQGLKRMKVVRETVCTTT